MGADAPSGGDDLLVDDLPLDKDDLTREDDGI